MEDAGDDLGDEDDDGLEEEEDELAKNANWKLGRVILKPVKKNMINKDEYMVAIWPFKRLTLPLLKL